jgi:DNA-binding IscR family transcriptional regulator
MNVDSRHSVALHVLLHISEAGRTFTSEELADRLRMNAVVLRRTLSALQRAHILRGAKGHGGGWGLARDLASVSLGRVLDEAEELVAQRLHSIPVASLLAGGRRRRHHRKEIHDHV